jgi:hypothetical protein
MFWGYLVLMHFIEISLLNWGRYWKRSECVKSEHAWLPATWSEEVDLFKNGPSKDFKNGVWKIFEQEILMQVNRNAYWFGVGVPIILANEIFQWQILRKGMKLLHKTEGLLCTVELNCRTAFHSLGLIQHEMKIILRNMYCILGNT